MKKLLCFGALAFAIGGSVQRPLMALPQVAETVTVAQASTVAAQPVAPTQAIVLDPGAAPRRQLRLQLAPGMEETGNTTMKVRMDGFLNGQKLPFPSVPTMKFGMSMKVDKVDANGDSHLTFGYTSADVVANPDTPPMMLDVMRSQLQGLLDHKGAMVISDRGQTKSFQIELPKTLTAAAQNQLDRTMEQLTNSLKQLSAPLPAEPVGLGAKWKVPPQKLSMNGMVVIQTATYELLELQGNTMKLAVTVEQTADPQPLNSPGLPPGASMQLKSLSSNGGGTITMHLDRLFPSQANIAVNAEAKMQVKDAKLPQGADLLMKSLVEMTLQSN